MNCVLALDISTRIIGCCIMDVENETVIYLEHIDLRKIKNIFDRVVFAKEFLDKLFDSHGNIINEIWIEDFARKFSKNKSSANVITKLAGFNYMISFLLYYYHKIEPRYKPARSARKDVGLKIPRKCDTKKFVLDFVKSMLPNYEWKKTKFGNDQVFEHDKADAYIIALSRARTFEDDS